MLSKTILVFLKLGNFFFSIELLCITLLNILSVIATLFVHLLEGAFAAYKANKSGLSIRCCIYWFFQTFMIGFPSTKLIVLYSKKQAKKL
jgi:hypothetical protein